MRDFTNTKRIVIKVGTNILSDGNLIDVNFIGQIAEQISSLVRKGKHVILVTSGAIGMGARKLRLQPKTSSIKKRQACAAVGQGFLMHEYQEAFDRYDQKVGQVLITNAILNNRKYYVNLKNCVETMLAMGVLPIVNENDCVSIEEIDLAFGDNDKLSALVASKIDAELLVILTDVEGLYDKNPRKSRSAKMIETVFEITEEIEEMAGRAGSYVGTGGMKAKINAIKIASQAGCKVILAHGRVKNVINEIISGEKIGTLFLPKRSLSNRKRWILNTKSNGSVFLDDGAVQAVCQNRSLLPVGITGKRGNFKKGDILEICDQTGSVVGKGITAFSSGQIGKMLSKQKESVLERSEVDKKIPIKRKAVVHANDLVLIS
ncbi:MAG: glutamate 5-kinase [Deltaproteobacteria bacterium]|nr:glutamate 5-kinase [Deltaproteobacteria bacterium]